MKHIINRIKYIIGKQKINVGDKYLLNEDDPFAIPTVVEIDEIKSGWVKYHSIEFKTRITSPIDSFKWIYRQMPYETTT